MNPRFNCLCWLLLLILPAFAQTELNREQNDNPADLRLLLEGGKANFPSPAQRTIAVDEEAYSVNAGDVFMIKVDVPGPATKVFPATVSADGFLLLPDAPSVNVKEKSLKAAKKQIHDVLKRYNRGAKIEVFLYQVRQISVSVVGAVDVTQNISLNAGMRLLDALQNVLPSTDTRLLEQETKPVNQFDPYAPEETEDLNPRKSMALRRVEIVRGEERKTYDLLGFLRLGELSENPYLLEGDIIVVPFKDDQTYQLSIDGAVNNELTLEYRQGDTLEDIIRFAGGLLGTADSSHIEIYRFDQGGKKLINAVLSFVDSSDYQLQPDDRIYVRSKPEFNKKYVVEIRGEVKYPGLYAIEDGITRINDVLTLAGGITEKASLKNARIVRRKILLEDKELNRLRQMTVEEMTNLEKSYFRLRTREDLRLVACDFEKLVNDRNWNENVILRDADIIDIPEQSKIVFVSGGVTSPGNVLYNESLSYREYITSAGGFNKRARKGDVKIIKSKSGVWLDAEDNPPIEEGDIIFVPESTERDWWNIFREALLVTSQVVTIIVLATR